MLGLSDWRRTMRTAAPFAEVGQFVGVRVLGKQWRFGCPKGMVNRADSWPSLLSPGGWPGRYGAPTGSGQPLLEQGLPYTKTSGLQGSCLGPYA